MYNSNYIHDLYDGSLPPQWSEIKEWKDEIIVVTAISPFFDFLIKEHKNEDPDIRFVAFVDTDNLEGYNDPEIKNLEASARQKWILLPICRKFSNPRMNAKIHKILIHEFFPNVKHTLWIDGNIQIGTKSIRSLIDKMGDRDIMLFRHYMRNCLYSEAHECLWRQLDSKEKIFEQICRYTQEGYPYGHGLAECPVMIRRNNERMKAFCLLWWDEILRGSYRDQISFPYVQYKTGVDVSYMPGTILKNDFFIKGRHNRKK